MRRQETAKCDRSMRFWNRAAKIRDPSPWATNFSDRDLSAEARRRRKRQTSNLVALIFKETLIYAERISRISSTNINSILAIRNERSARVFLLLLLPPSPPLLVRRRWTVAIFGIYDRPFELTFGFDLSVCSFAPTRSRLDFADRCARTGKFIWLFCLKKTVVGMLDGGPRHAGVSCEEGIVTVVRNKVHWVRREFQSRLA